MYNFFFSHKNYINFLRIFAQRLLFVSFCLYFFTDRITVPVFRVSVGVIVVLDHYAVMATRTFAKMAVFASKYLTIHSRHFFLLSIIHSEKRSFKKRRNQATIFNTFTKKYFTKMIFQIKVAAAAVVVVVVVVLFGIPVAQSLTRTIRMCTVSFPRLLQIGDREILSSSSR